MIASLFRIAVALVLVYLASQLVIWAATPSAEAQARKLVEQFRQQGPKQVGADMRLVGAEFAEQQLRLRFEMDGDRARSADWVTSFAQFRQKACADAMTREVNDQYALVYLIEADGQPVQRLVLAPKSCP